MRAAEQNSDAAVATKRAAHRLSASSFRKLIARLKSGAPAPAVVEGESHLRERPPATAVPDLPPFEAPMASPAPDLAMEPAASHTTLDVAQEPVSANLVPILPAPESPQPPESEAMVEEAPACSTPSAPQRSEEDIARRKQEIELEIIWRMILAQPTPEERAIYLREAAEIMGHAPPPEAAPPPAPEYDLSTIQPIETVIDIAPMETLPEPDEEPTGPVILEEESPNDLETAELARSLLDMMASGSAAGLPHERALAADTLLRLTPRLDLKPMVMIADRLSLMDDPPKLLVGRLIRDPRVEVSGPLIENCVQVTEKDLQAVVDEAEPAKLRLLARRRHLSRSISDALIKSDDVSVLLTLVRNAQAEISHDGFIALTHAAAEHPELLAPLCTRADLSAPQAFELFWLAPAQLRRFLLSRFLTESETLTKILKITLATNKPDEEAPDSPSQFAVMEALDRVARGKVDLAIGELSAALGVLPETIQRILDDTEGEPLIVMLKAANYPRSAVAGLLKKLTEADMPVISRNRDITELQNMFETLSFNKARILLTYWDWAQQKTGPYAPHH